MLPRFKEFISRHDLFDPQDRILLAVSGGIDSMVALSLFIEAGYSVGVAHGNFQMRGAESDDDEAFVRKVCEHASVKFFSHRFDTKNYAEQAKVSTQMAARELRYAWFGRLMEEEKYHWLATAHHLNDNLETVLSRWAKGASLDQLKGISLKREKIVRPLLFATRAEISAYAAAKKITWREDRSNATDDYQRNFIRHHIVPKLKEINPSLETTFADSLEKIQGAYEMMERGLGQLKDSITRTEDEKFFIDKGLLMLIKNPVFVCHEWLKPFGFDWDRCSQLVEAATSQSGKQFLSPTHQAVCDREFIIVTPRQEWVNEILIEEGQDKATLGPWKLTLGKAEGNSHAQDEAQGTFDLSKVKFPLLWRKWRAGDSFYPLGLGHRKKVSDLLIDEKVPVPDKNVVTVLVSAGEIVWVAGHRVDDRFKVTRSTKSVLNVKLDHI